MPGADEHTIPDGLDRSYDRKLLPDEYPDTAEALFYKLHDGKFPRRGFPLLAVRRVMQQVLQAHPIVKRNGRRAGHFIHTV